MNDYELFRMRISAIANLVADCRERDEKIRYESFTEKFTQCISRASLFVDVGAEYGMYTFIAARDMPKNGVIYAIEPQPSRFAALYDAVNTNNQFDRRIFVINCAIAGHQGELTLYQPDAQTSPSFETTYFSKNNAIRVNSFSVPCSTLDELFCDKKIDVLKIDIEGAEIFAVDGMQKILQERQTRIFIEIHKTQIEGFRHDGVEYLANLFRNYGYACYLCEGLRVIPKQFIGPGRYYLAPSDMIP